MATLPENAHELREALRKILENQGHGGQKEFAEKAQISPSYLNDIIKGRRKGSAKKWALIAATLDMSIEDLSALGKAQQHDSTPVFSERALRPDVDMEGEFEPVPKVKAKLSGGGGSFETEADIVGYYAFRSDFLRKKGNPKDMVLFDVAGNSMSPILEHGDTVMVDQSQDNPISGHIYAVGVDDSVIVKRVEARPGMLSLKSENTEASSFDVPINDHSNVRIIGRVVWSAREY